MKQFIFTIIFLAFSVNAWAGCDDVQQTMVASAASQASDFTTVLGGGCIYSVVVAKDGANSINLDVCDGNGTTCSKRLYPVTTVPASGNNWTIDFGEQGVKFNTGVWIRATSSGTYSITTYTKKSKTTTTQN